MGVSIPLQNGSNVIIYGTPKGGVAFDELDASLNPLVLGDQVAGQASAVSGRALADGGFSVEWSAAGQLLVQDYDAAGHATDQAHLWRGLGLSLAATGFASNADGASTLLANGDHVVSSETSNGPGNYQVHVQLYSPEGAPVGPGFNETAPPITLFTTPVVASLSDGSYEAAWVQQGNYSSQLLLEHFSAQGEALGQTALAQYGGFSTIGAAGYALAGLPDGDFVAAWTVQDGLNGGPAQVWAGEFTPAGAPVGAATQLGTATSTQAPVIDAEANGHYVVSWTSPSGAAHQAFADPAGSPPQPLGPAQLSQLGADISNAVTGALSGALSSGHSSGPDWLSGLHPFASGAAGFAETGHALAGAHLHGASFGFL